MKKQLTVALGLAVLATPVFASKARLQALGEDSYGSAYINDNRNIWLNAAQINNHKDLVTYEFGGNTNQDSAANARGEGGVYKAHGNFVYGVHFGGASNTANGLRAAAGLLEVDVTDVASFQGTGDEENNIDLFIGGDAGMKWGANLGYARTQGEEGGGEYGESLRTRLGVIMGDTQVYANINLINNAKGDFLAENGGGAGVDLTGSSKFEGKLGYQVGAIHAWEGNTLFADFRSFDMESSIVATGYDAKEDLASKQLEVGIGRVERLNDKTNLFAKASFFMRNLENDHGKSAGLFGAAGACDFGIANAFCESYDSQRVPVVVGVETEATSWLTLRASVSQTIWGTQEIDTSAEKIESGFRNTTAINAGATLKFGELSVDGVIGNNDGTAASIGEDTSSGRGTLRTDNLMTRVAMTYRF